MFCKPIHWMFSAVAVLMISCAQDAEKALLQSGDRNTQRADSVLALLSLEEKVGQMTQIDISVFVPEFFNGPKEFVIDENKLTELITKYHIGSTLNAIAIDSEAWQRFGMRMQQINMEKSLHKIPLIYGIDHIHGASYLTGATIFPHAISTASTFDTAYAREAGRVTVYETAHLGHHWVFNPVLDIARNKYWPRMFETYGEDAYLASLMGAAYVRGIEQSTEIAPYKTAACAKHFLGYSGATTGWDRSPAEISDQQLQEIYRPSFQAAVDAGVKTVMINSGEINGVPVHASKAILTDLLRNDMGFEGVAVTDWEDIISLWKGHKIAADEKEATRMAIEAGIDMSMVPYKTSFCDHLIALVKEGSISEERINQSVRRILKLKFDLGLFDNPYPATENINRTGKAENIASAQNAAAEALVLLKNNGVLPLTGQKVVVTGSQARSKRALLGGWSFRWIPTSDSVMPADMPTVFEALQQELGAAKVSFTDPLMLKASTLAGTGAVVVVAGERPHGEGFGNIIDLDMYPEDRAAIELAKAAGKPVIVVLVESRPRTFPAQVDRCDAIVYAGLPGVYGPQAIAGVLSGRINPSGKMSFSYPFAQGHQLNYNHKRADFSFLHNLDDVNNQRLFVVEPGRNRWTIGEFGTGLSYTDYDYSNLVLSDTVLAANGSIKASVTVKNTGARAGKEAVLWFVSDEVRTVTPFVKQLKHFEKKELQVGESAVFTWEIIPNRSLAYPNAQGKPVLEPGYFTLTVGNQTARFLLK